MLVLHSLEYAAQLASWYLLRMDLLFLSQVLQDLRRAAVALVRLGVVCAEVQSRINDLFLTCARTT